MSGPGRKRGSTRWRGLVDCCRRPIGAIGMKCPNSTSIHIRSCIGFDGAELARVIHLPAHFLLVIQDFNVIRQQM